MKKNEDIYCWYCGTKNTLPSKKCKKCNAKLEEKDSPILRWLFGETFKDYTGNFISKILFLIRNFCHLHLYGFTLTFAIAFTITSAITSYISPIIEDQKVEKTAQEYRVENKKEEAVSKNLHCDDGFTLKDNICYKEEKIKAEKKETCNNGYYLNGNKCYSNKTYSKNVSYSCAKTIASYKENYGEIDYPYTPYDKNLICLTSTYRSQNHACQYNFGDQSFTDTGCNAILGYERPAIKKETCPSGTTSIGDKCHKTEAVKIDYTCPDGYKKDGENCIKVTETEPTKE